MKSIRKLFTIGLVAILFLLPGLVRAQDYTTIKDSKTGEDLYLNGEKILIAKEAKVKEEEFRAVWISTVYSLDFPKNKAQDKAKFKAEYLRILDRLEELNLNAVIFQLRPSGDAFYESEINPWSKYISGRQGESPGWDPLPWLIEETHKRGMEFHGWFNPYRVTESYSSQSKEKQLGSLSKNNWARKNGDQVFLYEGKLYLNPSSSKVEDHILETIMEVVYKYDIDGVHLDDYFYPNRPANDLNGFYGPEEARDFKLSGLKQSEIGNWRRENINSLIKEIGHALKLYNDNHNKSLEFGVSPFGIWRHKAIDKSGSNTPTGSLASYDRQFVDSKKWVEEAWVDYITPQLYWTFDTKAAPYADLVDWWAGVTKSTGVRLYIGHGNYKKSDPNASGSWRNPREISNQLKFNDKYKEIEGSVFFRYENLLESLDSPHNNEFLKILVREHYPNKAKTPASKKEPETSANLGPVYNLKRYRRLFSTELVWMDREENPAVAYLITREELGSKGPEKEEVVARIDRKSRNYFSYTDDSMDPAKLYRYGIRALSKDNIKSQVIYR